MTNAATYTPDYLGEQDSVEDMLRKQANQGGLGGLAWGFVANNVSSDMKATGQGWWTMILGYLNMAAQFLMKFAIPDSSAAEVAIGEAVHRSPIFQTIETTLKLPKLGSQLQAACDASLRSFVGYTGISKDPVSALENGLALHNELVKTLNTRLAYYKTADGKPLTEADRKALAQTIASSCSGIPVDIATAEDALDQLKAAHAGGKLTTGYIATILKAQTEVTTTARGAYVPSVTFNPDAAPFTQMLNSINKPVTPPLVISSNQGTNLNGTNVTEQTGPGSSIPQGRAPAPGAAPVLPG